MEAPLNEQHFEAQVFCRLKPADPGKKNIDIKYELDGGELQLQDDQDVTSSL